MKQLVDAAREHARRAAALTGHSDKDWAVLGRVKETTSPWAQRIASEFVSALMADPSAAALIGAKREAREANLSSWFAELLGADADRRGAAFWSECVLVGLAHAAAGVPSSLVVAGAQHVEEVFLAHAMSAFDPGEALAVHASFARTFATAVAVMGAASDDAVRDTLVEMGVDPTRFQQRLRLSIQAQVRHERGQLPQAEWSPGMSVGVSSLDDQHRQLFELLAEFQRASSADAEAALLREVVQGLVDYTKIHFAFEETLLIKHDYPELGIHRAAHRKLAEQVERYAEVASSGAGPLGAELYFFLRTWLNGHIRGSDRRYGPFLNAHGVV